MKVVGLGLFIKKWVYIYEFNIVSYDKDGSNDIDSGY
jgi:hypothetical protein